MKIFNIYYLAANKQTDEYSLIFSGMLMCRLTAPLCLNYLCLLHRDSNQIEETAFTTIMGHLDLIPFVNRGLNIFLPLCISAICLAIYFEFANKILYNLGFERYIEDDEVTIDMVQTGRDLVKREKGKLIRNFANSTGTSYRDMIESSPNDGPSNPGVKSQGRIQDPESMVTVNLESPVSMSSTSSSSGLSRSSLLPKDQQFDVQAQPSPTNAEDIDAISRPSTLVLNMGGSARDADRDSRPRNQGFFDDV